MSIQLRKGYKADLDLSKLLEGESAVCRDGFAFLCFRNGYSKEFMFKEDLQEMLDLSPEASEALFELITQLQSEDVVTGLLSSISLLRTETMESSGYGIVSGLAVSAQSTPNMTVQISSGVIHMPDGTRYAPATVSSKAINAANASNPRKDIIYVNSAGVITYLAGTAASSPVAPTLPAGGLQLAELYVGANVTTIIAGNITDKRIIKYTNNYLKTLIDGKLDKTGDSKDNIITSTIATTDSDIGDSETHQSIVSKTRKRFNVINTIITAFRAMFCAEYSASATYALGTYVRYLDVIYRNTTAITVGEAWNAAKWTATTVMGEITTVNNNLGIITTMSTTEHVVGKWIDGKNIYEKTINFGALPNNATKNVAYNITDLAFIISHNGFAKNTTTTLNFPCPSHANGYGVQIVFTGGNISMTAAVDQSSYTTCYITLRYVKTT